MADQNPGVDQDTPPQPRPVVNPGTTFGPGAPLDPRMTGGIQGTIQSPTAAFSGPDMSEVEIDPNDALTEAQNGIAPQLDGVAPEDLEPIPQEFQVPQTHEQVVATASAKIAAEESKPKEMEPQEDVLDKIVPKDQPHEWVFGPVGQEVRYVQRRLSFIGKMQWFALVGEQLDKAMSGPNGISMNELLSAPGGGRAEQLQMADFRDADSFIRAAGKIAANAPEFITDSYCIWLGVPPVHRPIVADMMAAPEENGGLTDDQGLEIIEVFIDQNYDSLADFFSGKLGALQTRVRARSEARIARKRV